MSFWVLMCPKCGKVGIGEVNDLHKYVFKCKYCRRSTKLKKKSQIGLAVRRFGIFENPIDASRVCIEIKEKLGR